MQHMAHVGLIDTHTKGIGGNNDSYSVVLPIALSLVFHFVGKACMIEGGAEACLTELFGNLASVTTTAYIDNG